MSKAILAVNLVLEDTPKNQDEFTTYGEKAETLTVILSASTTGIRGAKPIRLIGFNIYFFKISYL
jgi:hypothetical protein